SNRSATRLTIQRASAIQQVGGALAAMEPETFAQAQSNPFRIRMIGLGHQAAAHVGRRQRHEKAMFEVGVRAVHGLNLKTPALHWIMLGPQARARRTVPRFL